MSVKVPREDLRAIGKKIMPGIGCEARCRYIEYRQQHLKALDPCLLCEGRPTCFKTVVVFP